MTNRATEKERHAFLFDEFGLSLAIRHFGEGIVGALPRYSRGTHKGSHKGVVVWRKAETGGWHADHDSGRGRVVRPGEYLAVQLRTGDFGAQNWGRLIAWCPIADGRPGTPILVADRGPDSTPAGGPTASPASLTGCLDDPGPVRH